MTYGSQNNQGINAHDALNSLRLLSAVHQAQQAFIRGKRTVKEVFDVLLERLLDVTASEYGFIGRRLLDAEGKPYLKVISMTNIAWNEETQALYKHYETEGMEFTKLFSLYGEVLTSERPFIANSPAVDPKRHGTPSGHPPLKAFLGVPICGENAMLGMFGIANRQGGYNEEIIAFLQPLTDTCAVIIDALHERQAHEAHVEELRQANEHLHHKEQFLRSLVESQTHYLVRTDLEGRYTYVNEGFVKHFGISEKILGFDALETIHPDDREACTATVTYCLQNPGKMKTVLLRKPTVHGTYLETEWEFIAVLDEQGNPYQIQCFGRDITERRDAERRAEAFQTELTELNKTLEKRVTERTKELQDLNREKDEFLGIAAHDLKNPLAAIKMSAERILLHYKRETFAIIPSVAQTINMASERMLSIIDNLLDINKLESGQFSVSPAECDDLYLKKLVMSYMERAAEKGITILYEQSPKNFTFRADKEALHHILDNLLSNAVKYSPQWKRITVTASLVPSASSGIAPQLRIEIQDEGQGISQEDRKRLFSKFARLTARPTAGEHSTGLGLFIVKKLVELQQGRVWCESEQGKGANFIVEIPQ
ncbi:MAG: ATP-binding protein [Candidatus Kapabacteria bacterium]|jgi:PAS domain S-box-containing protein|nr:ATP-binding protein [Candidatus Kapabacteria bacterium]